MKYDTHRTQLLPSRRQCEALTTNTGRQCKLGARVRIGDKWYCDLHAAA